jgi:predicted nucleotidyltransferase
MTQEWDQPTEAAQKRRHLAGELVQGLAPDQNVEVVLTGSVARGVADRFSDIEIRFLVDTLQPLRVYDDQLRAAGALVEPATDYWNTTIITKSWFKGVFIEAAWQAWDGLEASLAPVLAAETMEHWALVEA